MPTMQKSKRGGRPRSEFRHAVMRAAHQLAAEVGPFTRQDPAERLEGINLASPADCRLLRITTENMRKGGDLVKVGERAVPGSFRPMNLFMPGDGTPPEKSRDRENRGEALAKMLALWGG